MSRTYKDSPKQKVDGRKQRQARAVLVRAAKQDRATYRTLGRVALTQAQDETEAAAASDEHADQKQRGQHDH